MEQYTSVIWLMRSSGDKLFGNVTPKSVSSESFVGPTLMLVVLHLLLWPTVTFILLCRLHLSLKLSSIHFKILSLSPPMFSSFYKGCLYEICFWNFQIQIESPANLLFPVTHWLLLYRNSRLMTRSCPLRPNRWSVKTPLFSNVSSMSSMVAPQCSHNTSQQHWSVVHWSLFVPSLIHWHYDGTLSNSWHFALPPSNEFRTNLYPISWLTSTLFQYSIGDSIKALTQLSHSVAQSCIMSDDRFIKWTQGSFHCCQWRHTHLTE